MPSAKITSKGQITIPREVRDRLGLRKGDRVVFEIRPRNLVVIRPIKEDPFANLRGSLRHLARKRPVTVQEMNRAIKARAARKYRDRS